MKTEYIKSGAPKQTHPHSIKLQLNLKKKRPSKNFPPKEKKGGKVRNIKKSGHS